jgi:hypothetical protein
MKFVSRKELGWPVSAAPAQATAKGVKIHYTGSPTSCKTHADCVRLFKDIRKSHLSNLAEGYSDIAYNLGVCLHGYVFEGRGRKKRSGANGNMALNQAHYAIVAFLGSSGDTKPSEEMIEGLKDAIEYMRGGGAGNEIGGHRDGYATLCPGEPLYALVKAGKLVPGPKTPAPKPQPVYAPFPGVGFFRLGKKHKLITELGKALVKAGYKGYKMGPGQEFTRADIKAVAWFQRKQGWTGSGADGYPGPETWKRLKVAQPK